MDHGSRLAEAETGQSAVKFDAVTVLVAAAVFASFLAYSHIQAVVPAPNEPHYLCKAKYYWDRDFCPNDIFLESSNTHLVFYQTVGLLTMFLSLEQTAWVGRIIAYALLALGWTTFVSRLIGSRAAALWAAWVFLAIATVGNLSGEWMVGGVEAKVFSYAFVFLGIDQFFRRRWWAVGLFLGLAVSFHPVVGVWAVIAGGLAAAMRLLPRKVNPVGNQYSNLKSEIAIALLIGVICSLPGLLPAFQIVLQERHPQIAEVNRLMVFERVGHHLDPTRFRKTDFGDFEIEAAWLGYALLVLFTLGLNARRDRSENERWFGWFVIGAVSIALVGLAIGLVPRLENGRPDTESALFDLRVSLMKFYPFRLADIMVPVAAATSLVAFLERRASCVSTMGDRARFLTGTMIYAGFLAFACLRPIADRNPSHMKSGEYQDWMAVCVWVKNELPRDANVLTPPSSWGFKWYAQRAEYVSYKDCPQDASGIIEWQRRQRYITTWGAANENFDEQHGYTRAALRKLSAEGVTHILCSKRVGPFAIEPIYPRGTQKNNRYAVYRLKDAMAK